MRTTLTMDDDLAQSIEDMRARRQLSFREAIDQLLRAGLQSLEQGPTKSKPYSGPVFRCGLKPGIDPNRMNQLADQLEVEEHLKKMAR